MDRPQPSPRDEMKAYDRLPVTVRRALSAAGVQFSASHVYRLLRKGYTARELVELIESEDRTR